MSAKTILGAMLIVLAASLAGGGVYALHTLKRERADPETLCPASGAKSYSIIIIDKTDPLSPAEQADVRAAIEEERDNIPAGGRITVWLLVQEDGASSTVLTPLADLCNPGSEANPLYENPKHVAARYANSYAAPVATALASFNGQGSAFFSPIATSIASAIGAAHYKASTPLRLILVSDLMEHTPEASAYSGTLTGQALEKLIPGSVRARLAGAQIKILLLKRPKFIKSQETAVAVWRQFLKSASGNELEFISRP